jgi:cadmium resistance transport/sequestration family protein
MMPWFVAAGSTDAVSVAAYAVIAFIATNIDDLIILMLFFAQVNYQFRKQHIYLGQYLGFAALVVCSLPGFFGGLVIPKPFIGLLGFVPIAFGIRSIIHPDDDDDLQTTQVTNQGIFKFIHPQIFNVATVTFANGGDNIGIYIPLFASHNLVGLGVILSVFFLLVGVWCFIAGWLAGHRAIAPVLTRYSHIFVPIVLIGLGIYILIENETWKLFISG